jgi:membrane protease YdiL (CAAX protease family)
MATTQMVQANTRNRQLGISLLVSYLLVYAGTLFAMHQLDSFDVSEPLFVLAILGAGFSLAAWLLTIGADPLDYPVSNPRQELAAIVVYLIPLVLFVTWGLELLHHYVPAHPQDAIAVLGAKMLVFVVLPVAIMRKYFGYSLRRLMPVSARGRHLVALLGMSVLLLAFQAVLGNGLRKIMSAQLPAATLWYGLPLSFLWLALEVGVVEEFFFRVLLQTRLAAVLKSELAGIVVMSLIFGLVHAPGLYLRTGLTHEGLPPHPSLLMAVGYSIVVTSVAGFFLGVLWARTRNFAVVVLAHAMTDLLPDTLSVLLSLRLLH